MVETAKAIDAKKADKRYIQGIKDELRKFKKDRSLTSVKVDASIIGMRKLFKLMQDANLLNLEERLTMEIDKGSNKNYYPLTEKTIHNLSNHMIETSFLFSKDDDEEVIEDLRGRYFPRPI